MSGEVEPEPRPEARRSSPRWRVPVALGFAAFLVHACLLGSWIVDDAGITFSYARNLANGHGLVAQTGAEPVEGLTNLLWALALLPAFVARVFDPVWTPKILSAFCVLGLLTLMVRRLAARADVGTFGVSAAAIAVGAATPFAVWTMSGLENALYVLLLGLVLRASLGEDSGPGRQPGTPRGAVTGILVAVSSLARPEAVAFLPVAVFVGSAGVSVSSHSRAPAPRRWTPAWLAFAVSWTTLTLFRAAYFGDVLPNTYFAKRGAGSTALLALREGLGLVGLTAIFLGVTLLLSAASCWLADRLAVQRNLTACASRLTVALGAFVVASWMVWKALPTDWMPEFRFATPLVAFTPFLFVSAGWDLGRRSSESRARRLAAMGGGLALLASLVYSVPATRRFLADPTISLAGVAELSSEIAAAASDVGLERPTVALPDIGGALWLDRFDVVDLAGLTDREIGMTSKQRRGELVLSLVDHRRPDLLWTHPYWTARYGWLGIPRFDRVYALAWTDGPGSDAEAGSTLFVRRDLGIEAAKLGREFSRRRAVLSSDAHR